MEPILYQVIHLPTAIHVELFARTADAKVHTVDVISDNVQVLDFSTSLGHIPIPRDVAIVLRVCEGAQSLWISDWLEYALLRDPAYQDMVSSFAARPQRIRASGIRLCSLFSELLKQQPKIFSDLTHIQLDWPEGLEYISLPSLTHITIIDHPEANDGDGLLCESTLKVLLRSSRLVVCCMVVDSIKHEKRHIEAWDEHGLLDPRLVILRTGTENEWTAGYSGQEDIFALAENLVRPV